MDYDADRRRALIIRAILGVLVLFTFWPVTHCEFVLYDDPQYVTANPNVLGGLTLASIRWAFTTGYYGNWFPLTWLSHICDVELFGPNAGWHHLTSLLLHFANTLLLFELLRRTTAAPWRSAVVAALFAVHPLRVESVAWVAERKDVLSTFFFMLTLLAYALYTQSQPGGGKDLSERGLAATITPSSFSKPVLYGAAFFLFACALMSKAMVVTLPFVLLLLDMWPLRRLNWPSLPRLVLEKVPFFILAVTASAVTFFAQRAVGAMGMVRHLSLGDRIANALISYVKYLWKTVWPSNLAILYPHEKIAGWEVVAASGLILVLSAGACVICLRRPYVLVGWLWFLGTLVPAIGLIQVGEQAMADRFTYVPCVGLLILVVWWASDVAYREREKYALAGVAVLVIAASVLATRHQLTFWQNSQALFEHDVLVTGGTGVIYNNLGMIQAEKGKLPEAEKLFVEGLRRQPSYDRARVNLAWVLAREGRSAEAAGKLTNMDPAWELEGHRLLAQTFMEQMKAGEATTQYMAAVMLAPTNATFRETLGASLYQQNRMSEAAEQFAALVSLRGDAESHWHLALALQAEGETKSAIEHYREAIRLKPDWTEPLNDLAWLLATDPRPEFRDGAEAVRLSERACVLNGHKEARFLGTLDAAYAEAGRFPEAITTAEQARQLALDARDQQVADAATERLTLYRAKRPYHQPQP